MVVVNHFSTGPALTATVAYRGGAVAETLANGVRLPADLHAGDVLAAPCTGAYQDSVAAHDNSAVPRTPIVAVGEGRYREITRQEGTDLLDRNAG